MEKYITYVETKVGTKSYTITVETDESMSISDRGYYYADKARVVKVVVHGSNTNEGPFQENEFYNKLRFPINCTLISEKKFEY
jgi:hypothetical protein